MTNGNVGSVGLVVLEFKIPCAPSDDPRFRMIRTLRSALRPLEEAEAHTGLPLQGVLRDPVGMTGMYTVVYNP